MTRLMNVGFCLALAVTVAAAVTGCAGTTKSGTAYTTGMDRSLNAMLPADIDSVHKNALTVLQKEFGYTIEKESKDALEGMITARTARGALVKVETYKEGDNSTNVKVNAGFMDNFKAREILSRIEQRSAGGSTTATATAPTTVKGSGK